MVIGDSYRKDIYPSHTLGCKTVWLKGACWEEETPSPDALPHRIIGSIEGAQEGDTVSLGYSCDGMDFSTVSKTVIKNGEFSFTGKQDDCKIYYIGYDSRNIYALFFLEAGDITAHISPISEQPVPQPEGRMLTSSVTCSMALCSMGKQAAG